MKTPMQELLEWLDKYGDNRLYGGRELTVHEIKNKAKSLLDQEKEVIMDAVKYGCSDWGSSKDAEHYYNETFNTKER